MRTIIKDTMTTVAPDLDVWKQERNFCTITGANAVRVTYPATGTTLYTGVFYKGTDGKIYIDISDLIRIAATGVVRFADVSSSATTQTDVDWNVVGLINPTHMIIPPFEQRTADGDIVAPYRIIADIGIPSVLEFNGYADAGGLEFFPLGGADMDREITIPTGTTSMSGIYKTGIDFRRDIQPLEACKLYACVQWVSRSGVVKRATWEARKITDNVVNSYEIARYDNAYETRKGQQVSMQLVMENVSAYDLWYYSDIVTSDDVRVTFNTDDYAGGTIVEACRVDVTDKKVQQLDGDADHSTLIVNVNFRRYDTV